MRVVAEPSHLEVEPGLTAVVDLQVVNTGDVIDGVSAHVLGFPVEYVASTPAMLPLFPSASGKVTLDLAVPSSHPAGRHPLTVEIISHGTSEPSNFVDIDLAVAARPAMRIESQPRVVRARRGARYVLTLSNQGNVPLDVVLKARDPDREVRATFTPERRRVEPGAAVPVILSLRGPRMLTGAEIERTVVVEATARAAVGFFPVGFAGDEPSAEPVGMPLALPAPGIEPPTDLDAELEALSGGEVTLNREAIVQLRQRPLISRGLVTILVLLSIVAVWAGIFLFGLARVLASDPMTKQAPPSFYASLNIPATPNTSPSPVSGRPSVKAGSSASGGGSSGSGSSGSGSSGTGSSGTGSGGAANAVAPAGALSKTGQVLPGMGGTINGTVLAANDGAPVGLILVRAYRMGVAGLVQMSSAATQTDGTYSLAGLFPTSYYLEFSAKGYKTQWYPGRPGLAGARRVPAAAQATKSGIDATIVGLPATISGTVDPGETLKKVTTQVTARALLGAHVGKALATAKTDAKGNYLLRRLPAPGAYELTFITHGYQPSTLVVTLVGGDARLEATMPLAAGTGQISGVVTDGATPLGGATVTTTVAGKRVTVLTPTTGQVGVYVIPNLPTPSTYVVTISSSGHGSATRIVDLTAGQRTAGLNVNLTSGTGTIGGQVVGPNGQGIGGAKVVVGGAVASAGGSLNATTLTAGSPGAFSIDGLHAPGSYTLTVTYAGYAPASVPVTLSGAGAPAFVTIRLASSTGRITGRVTGPTGTRYAGATVTATDGHNTFTATSGSSDGTYLFGDLPAGTYSVTVTSANLLQQTALVTVSAGTTAHQDLQLVS